MKWEERWTYDAKTFKPKTVKVRERTGLYWNNKVKWDGAGHKTYFEGETLFASEREAREAGIAAAKSAIEYMERMSARSRDDIKKANETIAAREKEAARVTKLLAKLEATP